MSEANFSTEIAKISFLHSGVCETLSELSLIRIMLEEVINYEITMSIYSSSYFCYDTFPSYSGACHQ